MPSYNELRKIKTLKLTKNTSLSNYLIVLQNIGFFVLFTMKIIYCKSVENMKNLRFKWDKTQKLKHNYIFRILMMPREVWPCLKFCSTTTVSAELCLFEICKIVPRFKNLELWVIIDNFSTEIGVNQLLYYHDWRQSNLGLKIA